MVVRLGVCAIYLLPHMHISPYPYTQNANIQLRFCPASILTLFADERCCHEMKADSVGQLV